jgi:cytochrome b561
VAAIVIAVAAMFVRDAVEDKFWRQALLEIHRQLGLLVLMGVGVRIALRVLTGLVDHAPDMAGVVRWAARMAHVLLYGLLIALPLEGWALTSAHGITLALLGTVHLPNLIAPDSELADVLSDYHVSLSWILLIFVGMHAAAALWHHFVRRDAVLTAMLPRRRSRSGWSSLRSKESARRYGA